jgi:hypothetical protein
VLMDEFQEIVHRYRDIVVRESVEHVLQLIYPIHSHEECEQ